MKLLFDKKLLTSVEKNISVNHTFLMGHIFTATSNDDKDDGKTVLLSCDMIRTSF